MSGFATTLWRTANRFGVWVYRRTGGKVGGRAQGGSPVLILTVAGRTSGRSFSTPVAYFRRDGGWLVVGSGGGQPQGPQWFKNLRAADRAVVEVGRERHEVAVRVLLGEEHDDAFAQVVRENPSFGKYPGKAGRPIPVALLTPR